MTPAEMAALDRILAGLREVGIARFSLQVQAHECAGAFRNFSDALRVCDERVSAAEAREIASHPDLAEVNVYLDGYFA